MSSNDLFRRQVLEARNAASSRFGRPAATVPPAWSWFILSLAVFFAALFIFATLVDFSRKETVEGRLRYTHAEARIVAERTGVIDEMFVSSGTLVQTGQPLIEIESERYLRNGEKLSDLETEQLEREIASIEAQKLTAVRAAGIAKAGHQQRAANIHESIETAIDRERIIKERLEIASNRFEEAKSFLAEGLISQSDVDARRSEYNSIDSEIATLDRAIANDRSELSNLRVQIAQTDSDLSRDLAGFEQQISRLKGEMKAASSGAAYQMVASIDGVVTAVQVRQGEPVEAGRLMMAIVPDDSELFAELFLPSSAIAFIKPGQEVKLQYDALPYQKFGVGQGVVESISSTAFLSTDLGLSANNETLLYRVEVTLARQDVDAFGQPIPLQSGMELSADIILEERRVIEWVLAGLRTSG